MTSAEQRAEPHRLVARRHDDRDEQARRAPARIASVELNSCRPPSENTPAITATGMALGDEQDGRVAKRRRASATSGAQARAAARRPGWPRRRGTRRRRPAAGASGMRRVSRSRAARPNAMPAANATRPSARLLAWQIAGRDPADDRPGRAGALHQAGGQPGRDDGGDRADDPRRARAPSAPAPRANSRTAGCRRTSAGRSASAGGRGRSRPGPAGPTGHRPSAARAGRRPRGPGRRRWRLSAARNRRADGATTAAAPVLSSRPPGQSVIRLALTPPRQDGR